LLFAGVAPSTLAVAGIATTELGGFDCKNCDWQHASLSFLQMSVRRSSKSERARQPSFPSQIVRYSPTTAPVQFQRVVWIKSFPRSGSSMLLDLIQQVDFPVFALFEPCSKDDALEPWLARQGCGALLTQLGQCNFTGIRWLFGWNSPHSSINGANDHFDPESASKACQSANLVVFKTVTWGHDLDSEVIPFLEANTHFQAISLIRDPRSIFASMRSTVGFKEKLGADVTTMLDICNNMYQNLHKSHPRMHDVLYETLVKYPDQIADNLFTFMAIPKEVGTYDVSQFLRDNFNNADCNDDTGYSTCQGNSTAPVERYTQLSNEMLNVFSNSIPCRSIAQHYGFNHYDVH